MEKSWTLCGTDYVTCAIQFRSKDARGFLRDSARLRKVSAKRTWHRVQPVRLARESKVSRKLTVSRASAEDDSTTGELGSAGSVACTFLAISAILRRDSGLATGPNETPWKESALLLDSETWKQLYIERPHPRLLAERHNSFIFFSPTLHAPSERKITTGALFKLSAHLSTTTYIAWGWPFWAPVALHHCFCSLQSTIKTIATGWAGRQETL